MNNKTTDQFVDQVNPKSVVQWKTRPSIENNTKWMAKGSDDLYVPDYIDLLRVALPSSLAEVNSVI